MSCIKKLLGKKGDLYKPEQIIECAKKEYELEKDFFIEMKKNKFDIFKTYNFLPKDISR